MSTLSPALSDQYTQRYEALLRATSAIGTCSDCDAAADALLQALQEVVNFDYLQLIAFENNTRAVAWNLLYSNGARQSLPPAEVDVEGSPVDWAYESQHVL